MPQESTSNSQQIVRNTLLLYVRMFLTMIVGLYTSRIVLQTLGADDYGIYNLVGGFVMMLAYLNSVFVSASQRYLAFFIGKGDEEKLHRVFCTSMTIHAILGCIILMLAETVGLWFVNHALNIAPERMEAANWVYQFSILALIVNIIGIPYNSSVIAHEHMNVFAYISIIEVVMKLVIVYVLLAVSWDHLITYAALMALIGVWVCMVYIYYCRKHFKECHYRPLIDRTQIKEMGSYAGWTAVGTLGFTFKDQALNILLNLFLGTAVNAARGIAVQVNTLVGQFATNFFMAVSPQIIKQYASGNEDGSRKIVYSSAKFAFFLMAVIILPLSLNLHYILQLWLDAVPQFTYEFLLVILVGSLIATLASSTTTALQATGNIKVFQISISILFLLELPIAYGLLSMGAEPYIAVAPSIITQFIGVMLRFIILSRQVNHYSISYFLTHIILKSIAVVALAFAPCLFIQISCSSESLVWLLGSSMLYVVISCAIIFALGFNHEERSQIQQYAARMLHRK